jgi:hypothetical protein
MSRYQFIALIQRRTAFLVAELPLEFACKFTTALDRPFHRFFNRAFTTRFALGLSFFKDI